MLLLTWFGSVLRAETESKMLIHGPLWPAPEGAPEIRLDIPSRSLDAPREATGMSNVTLEPGAASGTVHFRREDRYLRTVANDPALVFVATPPEATETYLLIEPFEAEALRAILAQAWILEPHGARIRAETVRLIEGFALALGDDLRLDLALARPTALAEGGYLLRAATDGMAAVWLRPPPPGEQASTVLLRATSRPRRVPATDDPAAFAAGTNRRLILAGGTEYLAPPLTVSITDQDWIFMRHAGGGPPALGPGTPAATVHRETGKLVLLASAADGLVFDEAGPVSDPARVAETGDLLPDGMARGEDGLYIDRALIDAAPILPGAHLVVGHSALQDRGRGRIETLLALHVLREHAPAGTPLLMPAALPGATPGALADIPDLLAALGFADLPAIAVDRPVARVEEAYWLNDAGIAQIPARLLRAFRARVPKRPRVQGRRIIVRQTGSGEIENEDALQAFAERRHFEVHTLEAMSPEAQMALFQEAVIVVAPHGPALANLIFAPPGLKVIEISPDAEFRPYYWRLAAKLGLSYAVLPCPTTDGTFGTPIRINGDRLGALFRLIGARL